MSPDLRSPTAEEEGFDLQTASTHSASASSSGSSHGIEPGHSEEPAPDTSMDHRLLLARGGSNSVGSSSNLERSVSEFPLTGHYSER